MESFNVKNLPGFGVDLIPWRRVKRWSCVRCGKCCSFLDVPLTYEEEGRLRKYGDVFRKGRIGVYLRRYPKKDGCCIFFDGKCKIYHERPEACRRYPFYLREKGEDEALYHYESGNVYVYIDRSCSGVGLGEKVEKVIQRLLKDLKF